MTTGEPVETSGLRRTQASGAQKLPPFHDVTVGNNRYYPASTGWDFATGLGSPDVYNLAQDVVDYLQAHPSQ